MVLRARFSLVVFSALAAAAVLVPVGGAGLRARSAAPTALPTIYVKYTNQCVFSLVNDYGQTLTNIAPGQYQIQVVTPIMFKLLVPSGDANAEHMAPSDMTGCRGWVQFQLTGPGVSDFTTLDSGCDAFYVLPSANFQNNSQYIFQDLNQPSVTRTVLQVSSSGLAWTPSNPYGGNITKGSTQKQLVGSSIGTALKGTVFGRLAANGKATLTWKGKPLTTIKQGRYAFWINDQNQKGEFLLESSADTKASTLTTNDPKFTGRHRVFVGLTAGVWTYALGSGFTTGITGKGSTFIVTR